MNTQSSAHFYVEWAKTRLDEMDATLTSLESTVGSVQAEARDKANKVLATIRKERDDFRETIKKQVNANEAAWISAKAKLETQWSAFEAEVEIYVESFGAKYELHQATFQHQAEAQLKAWRDAADKFSSAASEFAAERRGEIDATLKRMADAAVAAEEKLKGLNQAGGQSWSVLKAALTETRGAFDRATQAVREEFKRVI